MVKESNFLVILTSYFESLCSCRVYIDSVHSSNSCFSEEHLQMESLLRSTKYYIFMFLKKAKIMFKTSPFKTFLKLWNRLSLLKC